MPVLLEEWQNRLEGHFESLAHIRAGSGLPIFALEHGLNGGEIEEVSSLLRSRLENRLPLSPHWLPWVVYATERGYAYTGDEYWPSFEEQTPGWEFGDRYKLVPWFRKFQKTHDGVVPSGRWANHFTIISWPITHAILPRYLQRQFARTLYDIRYRLAALETLAPAAIGRVLAVNAHHASTRFQEFLQQEELTGRIVLALLGEPPAKGKEPIYPPTLQRIVEGLEGVRRTREWLGETRRIVRDRFTGIGRGLPGPGLATPRGGPAAPDANRFGVRPSILLSHRGGGTWSVRLEVPSFRNVAMLSPDILSFLKRTRCRLNGADDFKPAGWLLSGNRKGVLKSWPDLTKPLIQFEQSDGKIDHLLESECRLTPGPVWLFRVASDGTAREITGCIVRPGGSYIVITTRELPEQRAGMSRCCMDCAGIKSFRVQVPSNVSTEDTAWLDRLDLQVARTIRVWPAGLPGRGWDGEGSSEWLTTEAPCFGIVHDHPVDAYSLCLNHGTETVVEAGAVGYPTFVRIAPLPAGTHTLTVKARRSTSLDPIVSTPAAEGFVQLDVRESEPWIPGAVSHSGLIATIDPHDADLDTFWRNEVSLSVLGPESHSVRLAVSLEGRDGREILSEQVGNPMVLPIMPDAWSKRFGRLLKREENAWRYLEAAGGRLTIRGEELGEFSFQFEHDVPPLRWVPRRDRDDIVIRLIDDTGLEGSGPEVFFFSMERPLKAERCPSDTALSGMVVKPAGGLFYAKQGDHSDMVVVSAGLTSEGLKGLGVSSEFTELRDGSSALADSICRFAYWYESRLYGPLVNIRRKQIVGGFLDAIYELLCGSNWASAEAALRNAPTSQNALDTLQRMVEKRPTGFAAVLCRDHANICEDPTQTLQRYSELAARYRVSTDVTLCDFALGLASEAQGLPTVFGGELDGKLNAVRSNPAILRGARLLALLCARENDGQAVRLLPRSE